VTSVASPLVDAGVDETVAATLDLAQEFGGGQLLLSDFRVAFILANHARRQALERLFGVLPDQDTLLTLVLAMTLAQATHLRAQRWLKEPSIPAGVDGMLAGASVRELLYGVAGTPTRDAPFLGSLLMFAVLAGTAGPVAAKSLRVLRGSSHQMATGFHHRYGYLVDPGHWRGRRAQRRNHVGPNGRAAQPLSVS
jgi:hypothetical protein